MYPPNTLKQLNQQGVIAEGLSGRLAGVALYGDVLGEETVRLLYRAGGWVRCMMMSMDVYMRRYMCVWIFSYSIRVRIFTSAQISHPPTHPPAHTRTHRPQPPAPLHPPPRPPHPR